MSTEARCSRCGSPIPERHLAAGYARPVDGAPVCATCLTPGHGRTRIGALPRAQDPRRTAWTLAASVMGAGALFCFYQPGMGGTPLGMLLLVLTAFVAFNKVLDGAVR